VSENDYGDLIEKWKVDLIEMRARAMGFSEDEIPDLQQEIVLQFLGFEYDETLGASENTALHRIIDRKLINARRDKNRDVRRLNNETVSLEDAGAAERPCPGMPDIELCELRLDLEAAMADLEGLEKAVCEGLLRGESKTEIARAQGCSNANITKAVRRLRRKLASRGLHEYLG
jgi:DNA-directed RNA polymerase specialized sigma24 family protein